MAYLNVRDRKIEATIAYVGPELAGRKTNFERLGEHGSRRGEVTVEDDGLTLDWHPTEGHFPDCDVRVKLVAPLFGLDTARLDDVLSRSDGLVLVVEATAEGRAETMRALDVVKAAVGRQDASATVPVVVQLNKADLADPALVEEVVQATSWPVVHASAAKDEGVTETLDSALKGILEALREPAATSQTAPILPKNPLLQALKEVLREAVSERTASIAAAVTTELEGRLASRVDAMRGGEAERTSESDAWRRAHDTRLDRIEQSLDGLRALQAEQGAERASVTEALGAHKATLEKVAADLTELRRAVDAKAPANIAEVQARLDQALATQSRNDREHLTSVAAVLRRAVDGIASELRSLALADKHEAVTQGLSAITARTESIGGAIDAVLPAVQGLSPRIAAVESAVQRDVRGHVERVLNAVAGAQSETAQSLDRAEKRSDEIKAHLDEFVEELKRRKKGWFG